MVVSKRVLDTARAFEIIKKEDEDDAGFVIRVVHAYMERYGDAVRAVELLTGKNSSEWSPDLESIALGLHLSFHQEKKQFLELVGDTYFGMSWERLGSVLQGNGFEKVYAYPFAGRDTEEEFGIWAKRDKGYLLVAESFNMNVNAVDLHYELPMREADKFSLMPLWRLLEQTSNGPCLDESGDHVARTVEFDGREGLVSHLQKIESLGVAPHVPWRFYRNHHLWLCDYSEKNQDADECREINRRKVDELPVDIQEMIGYR